MLPIKENKVAFLTDSRGGLIGNFRFVYEELERRGGFDIKSICKPHDNMKKTFMEKIRIVYYMATCKAVFLDDYYPFIYNIKQLLSYIFGFTSFFVILIISWMKMQRRVSKWSHTKP